MPGAESPRTPKTCHQKVLNRDTAIRGLHRGQPGQVALGQDARVLNALPGNHLHRQVKPQPCLGPPSAIARPGRQYFQLAPAVRRRLDTWYQRIGGLAALLAAIACRAGFALHRRTRPHEGQALFGSQSAGWTSFGCALGREIGLGQLQGVCTERHSAPLDLFGCMDLAGAGLLLRRSPGCSSLRPLAAAPRQGWPGSPARHRAAWPWFLLCCGPTPRTPAGPDIGP